MRNIYYYSPYWFPYNYYVNHPLYYDNRQFVNPEQAPLLRHETGFRDYGKQPFVVNIEEAAERNRAFRRALWTGDYLQVTLMSIGVGEEIGLEIHSDLDQFLRIEEGQGMVLMGRSRNQLDLQQAVREDYAIIVPAGTWHNLINTGNQPLKLYSIYAPPNHPFGTVHPTKADAMTAEHHEDE